MADKATVRKQKRREKQRKVREKKQKGRRDRNASARGGLDKAVHWPIGECYLSSNWHEQGAQVHAAFVRTHPSGRSAVAMMEVDLAHRGVVSCEVGIVPGLDHVRALLMERSDPYPMLETSPAQVVAVVEAGVAHGATEGATPPKGYADARNLFGDVDAEDSPHEVLVGAPAAKDAPKSGWFSKLLGG
jgi:hypothetical protein